MRIEFSPRQHAEPLEQLADGLTFLSGGIFQLIERVGAAANAHGFGGKVRLDVVVRELLDGALEPLASEYDSDELERAVALLRAAIELVGREFFPEQYEGGSAAGTDPPPTRMKPGSAASEQ
jgi:hypothetical protein